MSLDFHPLSLADRSLVWKYTENAGRRNCDLSFANLYAWRMLYRTEVAEWGGFLVFRFYADGHLAYLMPVGEGDWCAILQALKEDVERQLALLPRKEIAEKSLANSKLIVVRNMDEAIELTNSYAPEHLIIETADYMSVAERVVNAGSVFLGSLTPESAGDYASGSNHALPTNGYAKAYSGVSLDSFIRKITFQEIKPEGIRIIGPAIEEMAASEHLDAHKNAVTVRLDKLRVEN